MRRIWCSRSVLEHRGYLCCRNILARLFRTHVFRISLILFAKKGRTHDQWILPRIKGGSLYYLVMENNFLQATTSVFVPHIISMPSMGM